ncbi:PREDICTED: uncharacterized protein LOC106745409 [Dinoponera quadriceps]|uniref:Uncharacterized protein LOC106745409 n=1 Tax=Dinoponera quadriceps TaxID=609295 RepID=A0A6P3XF29_DINQU|nr:PREDICTED: uncharacterized protein LOC106745409 [Dinoponera quadriceps]
MEWSWSPLFSSPFALSLTTLFAIGVLKLVVVLYHVYTYWKKRGVPYIRAVPNLGSPWILLFRRMSFPDFNKHIYYYDPNAKYIGMMDKATPVVVLRDLELIKDVMVKDFEHFTDHAVIVTEECDPLFGKNIFSLCGDRWKEMRNTLSPSFTSSKMKVMFELVSRCSHEFTEYLADHPELWSSIDTRDAFRRYATDVIATSAFGISINSMKERNNEFFIRGVEASNFQSFVAVLKLVLFHTTPRLMKALGIDFFSSATSQFFKRIVAETIKMREEQGIVRPDMIHLLMQARNKEGHSSVHDMTLDDIVSQAFIFFLAGFHTSSTIMCFLVHELAVHRDIQDRLYEEIERHLAEGNGEISYELMSKMTYLDMVVSEALRKYPPALFIDRICVKSYKLSPSKPGCKSVIIEPTSKIWIPAYALHHDPNYFPDPYKFDPERFGDENKDNIVPYTYMPFGLGPRKCIANRFAFMEVKLVMVRLLQKFIFKTTEKTVDPMVYDKNVFSLQPDGGFWISLEKREKRRSHLFTDVSITMESSSLSLFSSSFVLLLTTLCTIGVLKFLAVLYDVYTYWSKRGVPHIRTIPTLGTPWQVIFRRISFPDYTKFVYNYDQDAKYIGLMDMATPLVLLRDPQLIKDVMVKDFEHFPGHSTFANEELDPLFGKNVFSLHGDRWKEMRNTLSPSFTANKMKTMFGLVSKCSREFAEYLADHPELCSSVDTKEVFRRYTTDVIATSAFGISVNSMKDRNNEFFTRGLEATNFGNFVSILKFILFRAAPRFAKSIGLNFFPSATTQFFRRIVAETIKTRDEQGIVRPDMIHLLMQARNKEGPNVHTMTLDDIVSQAFIFFFAGFETSSTLMCFLAHELAISRDIQDRLFEEVERHFAEENGEISYETVSKMTYLDMVVSETLRKYPPMFVTDRLCAKSYELHPAKPGCKSVILEPNSLTWTPIYALHHDPKYFPNPSVFDPERFSDENKDNIVPYSYVPFGVGPRMCIANRFALMETKLLIVHLLQKFIFKVTEKTVESVVFDKTQFSLQPDGGFWIALEKRK